MTIKSEYQARGYAKAYLNYDTLIVSENGDINANCNVDDVCTAYDSAEVSFFLLKGERTSQNDDARDLTQKKRKVPDTQS